MPLLGKANDMKSAIDVEGGRIHMTQSRLGQVFVAWPWPERTDEDRKMAKQRPTLKTVGIFLAPKKLTLNLT